MERVVYSDNAATTPISKNVYNAMLPYLTTGYGNPSSLYKLGRDEKKAMDEARGHLAKSVSYTHLTTRWFVWHSGSRCVIR